MSVDAGTQERSFDPDALREKYRQERDKRLRPDGNDQYVRVVGDHDHFLDDPFAAAPIDREPLFDDVDVLIVGGGFGGLLAGVYLRKAGVEGIRIIDNGSEFGGTWYWNRYPGAQCDIESYIYMPLLEETGYMPKEKYAFGDEILDYTKRLASAFGLDRDACFQTSVTGSRWDDDARRWIITTDRGDEMRARFIIHSTGVLNMPKLPGIEGIEDFGGHSFHTSRWDYAYTGGGPNGDLTGLRDKRVGVIGTGASAIQAVPHLGEAAEHLYVFQRTPSSVDVRGNRPTDPSWAGSLRPGWQRERITNFNVIVGGGHQDVDLVNDGWTDIITRLATFLPRDPDSDITPEQAAQAAELADFEKMESIRARVDAIVDNKRTAEALKPYYRQFCKRPCFHDEYLPTYNRPNVTLVDTDGKGITRITETGVLVGDELYEVDCLIFASGFEVGTSLARRSGFETVGRDGLTITETWANGPRTFHGFLSRGFPNCFFMGLTQTGFTPNFMLMLQEQAQHIAYLVGETTRRDLTVIEPSQRAVDEWQAEMERAALFTQEFFEACTPGYYNNEGHLSDNTGLRASIYGAGSEAFFQIIRAWREAGDLDGLEVS
jgi:cation diffusion facilitator CzcD-associated flavoprotein CzcO